MVFIVIMVISGYHWFQSMVSTGCAWSLEIVDGYQGFLWFLWLSWLSGLSIKSSNHNACNCKRGSALMYCYIILLVFEYNFNRPACGLVSAHTS